MAVSFYETGACADLDDFFTKLSTFATSASIDAAYRFTAGASNGSAGTAVNTAGDASGTTYAYKRFSMTRGGYYWLARYHTTGGVYCMVAPNDASAVWNSTTGKPSYDYQIRPAPAAGTYYFHQYKYSIHAICKLASGVHVHLNFGTLDKVGSWTGGEFFTGSYHEYTANVNGSPTNGTHCFMFHNAADFRLVSQQTVPSMRCVYNSKNFAALDVSYDAVPSNYNLVCGVGVLSHYATSAATAGATPNVISGYGPNSYAPYRSPGVPIEYQLYANAGDSLWYDLGTVEGARFVNISAEDAGDVIDTNWVVYPLSIKGNTGSVGNYASSANYGIAYYKAP